ncbi:hypothetical protein [Methylorubrum sp. SB2]|uniref:hypothetical protein n=1 Tax=Methylorubrum subtropicum TaxID=3138812 RepID=UPI00313C060C
MADTHAPYILVFSAIPGDPSALIEFAGTAEDWRTSAMATKTSAEIAADVSRTLDARSAVLKALRAVRSDCRDPDTDTALAPATGELVEAALAAMGDRS